MKFTEKLSSIKGTKTCQFKLPASPRSTVQHMIVHPAPSQETSHFIPICNPMITPLALSSRITSFHFRKTEYQRASLP